MPFSSSEASVKKRMGCLNGVSSSEAAVESVPLLSIVVVFCSS